MDRAILLVEDNPLDAELAVLAFEQAGVPNPVIVARDGVEALDLTASGDARPAVVLMDIKMPLLDGLDVLGRRPADPRLRAVPVVVLTSSREPADVDACYDLGANAYLVKPAGFEEMVAVARSVASVWLDCVMASPAPVVPPAVLRRGRRRSCRHARPLARRLSRQASAPAVRNTSTSSRHRCHGRPRARSG